MKRPNCPKCGKRMCINGRTPGGKIRWACRTEESLCYSSTNPDKARTQSGTLAEPIRFRKSINKSRRYIVTSAQNATPVHEGFWAALKRAAEHLKAELVVIPIRYKNPTSRWTQSQANEDWWFDEVVPYLYQGRKRLNANLMLMADIKTQPTAQSPLTGLESITNGESGVFGHSKLQFRTVATPQNKLPKVLVTTGSCTKPNYTDTKTGKMGEFHHSLAACLIEIKGRKFHIRQLNGDRATGEFTDLDKVYSAGGVKKAPPALALIMGDTHVRWVSKKVEKATFGANGIVQTLRPRYLAWHDLNDNHSRNPHHRGNPFHEIAKLRGYKNDVQAEALEALEYVRKHTPDFAKSVLVPSNHVDFLTRWIRDTDWRMDPSNAEFYLRTALTMVESTRLGDVGLEHIDPFLEMAKQHLDHKRTIFLRRDQSFTLSGIELAFHGDAGPNGARGSIKNMRRIGTRTVIGHSHTPGIEEGCYQVGTSTELRAEYTTGPSSWLNTHCILYASGKRSLITIIDGEWRL